MRVIAGRLGGRRLSAPRGYATRPTTDRVREALFSALGALDGAAVLDVYAGTGALGIEAISRGAARAVFVENARPALASLKENIDALDLGGCTRIVASPAARGATLAAESGPFDLVFLDPPYAALAEVLRVVGALTRVGAIALGGHVVVEHATRDAPPELAGLTRLPSRTYGDTTITLYLRAPPEPDEPA